MSGVGGSGCAIGEGGDGFGGAGGGGEGDARLCGAVVFFFTDDLPPLPFFGGRPLGVAFGVDGDDDVGVVVFFDVVGGVVTSGGDAFLTS